MDFDHSDSFKWTRYDGGPESSAAPWLCIDNGDIATEHLGETLTDGEAQTGAAKVAHDSIARLCERPKQAVRLLVCPTKPGIQDVELQVRLLLNSFSVVLRTTLPTSALGAFRVVLRVRDESGDQPDTALVGELYGVADDVDESLLEPGRIESSQGSGPHTRR